jgi:hypothetical protein
MIGVELKMYENSPDDINTYGSMYEDVLPPDGIPNHVYSVVSARTT